MWRIVQGGKQVNPPHTPITLGTDAERLNSNDLNQGFAGGPKVGLTRHGDCGYDLEFSFFEIDGWNSFRSIPPDRTAGPGVSPPDWLVFTAPGDFVQTTDYSDQSMAWGYQVTKGLLLKAGYEAIWLQGVALAPAQIRETLSHGTPFTDVYVQALGLDSSSGVFYHGATVGSEYAF
jgi:hypothetical protein